MITFSAALERTVREDERNVGEERATERSEGGKLGVWNSVG